MRRRMRRKGREKERKGRDRIGQDENVSWRCLQIRIENKNKIKNKIITENKNK